MKRSSCFAKSLLLIAIVAAIATGAYWKTESDKNKIDAANRELTIVGWRERVSLPDLGIHKINAKIDSGAKTSSLYAKDLNFYQKDGKQYVRFSIQPSKASESGHKTASAEVLEYRRIKSSNGQVERRPVIVTKIKFQKQEWLAEVTLTSRENMKYPMLLGRQAMNNRFLINPGRSYLGYENN